MNQLAANCLIPSRDKCQLATLSLEAKCRKFSSFVEKVLIENMNLIYYKGNKGRSYHAVLQYLLEIMFKGL